MTGRLPECSSSRPPTSSARCRIPGLVSVWDSYSGGGGTFGPRRQIDDVHGPTGPVDVMTVPTPSDHLAVIATYA